MTYNFKINKGVRMLSIMKRSKLNLLANNIINQIIACILIYLPILSASEQTESYYLKKIGEKLADNSYALSLMNEPKLIRGIKIRFYDADEREVEYNTYFDPFDFQLFWGLTNTDDEIQPILNYKIDAIKNYLLKFPSSNVQDKEIFLTEKLKLTVKYISNKKTNGLKIKEHFGSIYNGYLAQDEYYTDKYLNNNLMTPFNRAYINFKKYYIGKNDWSDWENAIIKDINEAGGNEPFEKLRFIPLGLVYRSSQLNFLHLESHAIHKLDFPFEFLSNLTKLVLKNNSIASVACTFEGMQNLMELDLSGNQITILSHKFQNLPFLKILNVSNNRLQLFPEFTNELPSLQILDLSQNQIVGISKSLNFLPNLIDLNIASNKLENIEALPLLTQLEKFNLNYNDIKCIPEIIYNTYSLRQFSFIGNRNLIFFDVVLKFHKYGHSQLLLKINDM